MASTLGELLALSSTPARARVDAGTSSVTLLRGAFPGIRKSASRASPESLAHAFLKRHCKALGIPQGLKGLAAHRVEASGKTTRVVLRQVHQGLPLFGAGVAVEIGADQEVHTVAAHLARPASLPVTPRLDVEAAAKQALTALGIEAPVPLPGELVIYDPMLLFGLVGEIGLAWSFAVRSEGSTQVVLIRDADGSVLLNSLLACDFDGVFTCLAPLPQYHVNEQSKVPDFVTFGPTGLAVKHERDDPAEVAFEFFSQHPRWFGTRNPRRQLQLLGVENRSEDTGMIHVRVQQMYGGVPVFGAELRVHLDRALCITSVSGNYVREPCVVPEIEVKQDTARERAVQYMAGCNRAYLERRSAALLRESATPGGTTAVAAIHGRRSTPPVGAATAPALPSDAELCAQAAEQVRDEGLVILPCVLSARPSLDNHLAWRFRFPMADLFVDARSGEVVFSIPNAYPLDTTIWDVEGRFWAWGGYPAIVNGLRQVSNPPSDAIDADRLLNETIHFYAWLGRHGYADDPDAAIDVLTNTEFDPDPRRVEHNAYWLDFPGRMAFSPGWVLGDIVAHEFTHAVTSYTANLVYLDESGALSEHYSDILGNLCFPEAPGQWHQGESAADPDGHRNLLDPDLSGDPFHYSEYVGRTGKCASNLDPVWDSDNCDNGGTHTNCGIGNRAAVLLCDGSWTPPPPPAPATPTPATTPGHVGIGRDRLAKLFYETLCHRLHPWARYMDELLNTWEVAHDLARNGYQLASRADSHVTLGFGPEVAHEVAWAFSQVGLDIRLVSGYFEVFGPGDGERTFDHGTCQPGRELADVILHLTARHPDGQPYWSGQERATNGGQVDFPGGIFGASITEHTIGTADKHAVVHWYNQGFENLDFYVVFVERDIATGVTTLPGNDSFSEEGSHSPDERGNNRGDDRIRDGMHLVGGVAPRIERVTLLLLDEHYNEVDRQTDLQMDLRLVAGSHFPRYGAHLFSHHAGTDDETVVVHWWLEPPCKCHYRVVYEHTGGGSPE